MKLRAFVFDAEPTVRLYLAESLRRRGYEVFAFPHGYNCSVCEGTACADVIIADAILSEGSGIDFLQRQKIVGCRNQHLAVMAGSWSPEERRKAHELGCQTFTKPFAHTELDEWLTEMEKTLGSERSLGNSYLEKTPFLADEPMASDDEDEN